MQLTTYTEIGPSYYAVDTAEVPQGVSVEDAYDAATCEGFEWVVIADGRRVLADSMRGGVLQAPVTLAGHRR